MTTSHLIALVLGLVALGVGLTTLIKPAITRSLLGIPASEGATYALRIGGMMLTAFGLVLVLFIASDTAGGTR
jgi:uncharacterized protein YjeT (DUF2065 family)